MSNSSHPGPFIHVFTMELLAREPVTELQFSYIFSITDQLPSPAGDLFPVSSLEVSVIRILEKYLLPL